MDNLWAPWRARYLKAKKKKGCVFCQAARLPKKNYVILKSRHSLAMLNLFPYNNGHLMIAPLKHIRSLSQLEDAQILDLFKTLNRAKGLLDKILKPQGYNIGINLAPCAGAGVPGHLHIHLVPRWQGDTNFMPVLHQTKIVSQSLDELMKKLRASHAHSKTN